MVDAYIVMDAHGHRAVFYSYYQYLDYALNVLKPRHQQTRCFAYERRTMYMSVVEVADDAAAE